MTFGSFGVQVIGVVSDNTNWLAVGDPVANVPDDPDAHLMEIPEADIVADDPGDHAVFLNFADGQLPRIFDDPAVVSQLGAGADDASSVVEPSFGVVVHSNEGAAIDLFLTVGEGSGGVNANTSPGGVSADSLPGATSAISTVFVFANAENAPIHGFAPVSAIDPREANTDIGSGREGEPLHQPNKFDR